MSEFTVEKSKEVAMFLELIVQQTDLAVQHLDMDYFQAFIDELKDRVSKYEVIGILDAGNYSQNLRKIQADLEFAVALKILIKAREKQMKVLRQNTEEDEALESVRKLIF